MISIIRGATLTMISTTAMPEVGKRYQPQVTRTACFPADYGVQTDPVSLFLAESNGKCHQFHTWAGGQDQGKLEETVTEPPVSSSTTLSPLTPPPLK